MRINSQVILDTTDLATEITSDTIELDHIYGYSIYILYTGSNSANQMETTACLQVSNDGVSWSTYHEFSLEGPADTCVVNATDVFYKMARVKLTVVAGSISPKLTVYKKGV